MKGLILKDLLNLKAQYKVFVVMILFFVVFALMGDSHDTLGVILTMITIMLPITALAYDERSQWDKYALTMPVSRRDLVLSKYLLGLLLAGASLIVNIAFQILSGPGLTGTAVSSCLGGGCGAIFALSLILPVMFKFGVEKGRLVLMLAMFFPLGIMFLGRGKNLPMPGPEVMHILPYAAGAALVLIFLFSLVISLRIYRFKEL
ncbi:MAG: ABC-2 transporter permease [Bacillota bacterium]|jgi:ABC-2 type transport system permease protein